jgi:exodeoxyribonuclease VII large subunit
VMTRDVGQRREVLESTARELHAIGPAQVLARGFTLTLGPDGKALRSISQAPPGTALETVLRDGRVRSRVDGGDSGADPRLAPGAPSPRRTRRAPKPKGHDDPGLFG